MKKENTMKNREMLMELKKVKPMRDKLMDIAFEIVESTFDNRCCSIDNRVVGDKTVGVMYEYQCCSCDEYGHEIALVPIEWFEEGFDYAAAYREMKQKEAEEEKKAVAKKVASRRKAKKAVSQAQAEV